MHVKVPTLIKTIDKVLPHTSRLFPMFPCWWWRVKGKLKIPLNTISKPNPKQAPYFPAYESESSIETKNPTILKMSVTRRIRRCNRRTYMCRNQKTLHSHQLLIRWAQPRWNPDLKSMKDYFWTSQHTLEEKDGQHLRIFSKQVNKKSKSLTGRMSSWLEEFVVVTTFVISLG